MENDRKQLKCDHRVKFCLDRFGHSRSIRNSIMILLRFFAMYWGNPSGLIQVNVIIGA